MSCFLFGFISRISIAVLLIGERANCYTVAFREEKKKKASFVQSFVWPQKLNRVKTQLRVYNNLEDKFVFTFPCAEDLGFSDKVINFCFFASLAKKSMHISMNIIYSRQNLKKKYIIF